MVTLIQYDTQMFSKKENVKIEEIAGLIDPMKINWMDIEITNQHIIETVAKDFSIHPLIIEDILDTNHLPKFEAFEDHCFMSLKMLRYNKKAKAIIQEHINLVFGHNILLTFQEGMPGDVFDTLRTRLEQGKGNSRKYRIDYLLYHCLDAIIDNYMKIAEILRERMEDLEALLLTEKNFKVANEVIVLKKKINKLRALTLPLITSINQLQKEGSHLLNIESKVYFQDLHDHLNYLMNFYERSREMLRDILDMHNANLSNETNRVMKTLTIISAIFIPLTFLAGLYGMNFQYMPELEQPWAYPAVLFSMLIISIGMVFWMKHKKWM